MANFNQIFIVGHAGGDPEMRFTPDGKAVTTVSVAVNDPKLQADGSWKDNTEWFRVTAWEKLAESVNQKVTKGAVVLATGKLKVQRWQDKEGKDRFTLEVAANKVLTFSKSEKTPAGPDEGTDDGPDEIPF